MKVSCNFCPYGTPKTDRILLVTLNGRDYLLCLHHARINGVYHAKRKSRKDI